MATSPEAGVRRIDRYILSAVVRATLLTLTVIASLSYVLTLMDEAGDVGQGDYRLGDAMLVVATMLPRLLYEAFPVAGLIGALLALGAMAANRELVALQAAGMSPLQMMGSLLRAGFVLVLVLLVLGEGIGPKLERWGQTYRLERMNRQVAFDSRHGFWMKDGNTFLNIRRATPEGRLQGVRIYELDAERRLREVIRASEGRLREGRLQLQEVVRSRLGEERVETQRLPRLEWRTAVDPGLLEVALIRPRLQSAVELLEQMRRLRAAGQRTVEYALAFWGKVATPVTLLVMLLLAVPLATGIRGRGNPGQQILLGALLGGVFYLASKGFYYAVIVFGLPPVAIALFPLAAFFLAAPLLGRLRRG